MTESIFNFETASWFSSVLNIKASRTVDDSLCYRCSSGNIQNSAYNFSTPAELQESKVGKLLIRKHVLLSSTIQLIYIDLEQLEEQLACKSQRSIGNSLSDQRNVMKQHVLYESTTLSCGRLSGSQTCTSMFTRLTSVVSEFRKILDRHQIS